MPCDWHLPRHHLTPERGLLEALGFGWMGFGLLLALLVGTTSQLLGAWAEVAAVRCPPRPVLDAAAATAAVVVVVAATGKHHQNPPATPLVGAAQQLPATELKATTKVTAARLPPP